MKKVWLSSITLMLIIISVMGISQTVVTSGTFVESNNTEVISEPTDGSLFVTGETIIIEGDVNGPLFAAGQNIYVEGDVNGPIFAAGNTITIEGSINGEVFLAGNTIRAVEEAEFSRDVFAAGNQIIIGASVGRDLFLGSRTTTIQNQVSRNAYISSNTLIFNGEGQIGGDLNYQAERELTDIEENVQGEVIYRKLPQQDMQMMQRRSAFSIVLSVVGAIVSAMLIWILLRGVTQQRWITLSSQLIPRPIMLILIGLGLSLITPFLIILSLISNVFSSIGILIAIVFFLLLFLGKIVTASVIGEYVLKNRIPARKYQDLISFAVAYIFLLLTSYIPFVGWIISLLCIFYTVGLAFRETTIRF